MKDTAALLRRKVFGIPAWLIGVVAIALLAFYLWRKRQAANAAAAAAAAGGASSSTAPIGSAAVGDLGSGTDTSGYLSGFPPSPVSTPVPVTTSPPGTQGPPIGPAVGPGTTITPQMTQQGSGFWLGPVSTAIHGTDGNWYQWESPAVAAAFPSAQRYVQIEPNYFVPVTASTRLAAGTPQFLRTAAPVANTAGQMSAPGAPANPSGYQAAYGATTAQP